MVVRNKREGELTVSNYDDLEEDFHSERKVLNVLTMRWRKLLEEKEHGEARLQYLVGLTDEQKRFLNNMVVISKQKMLLGRFVCVVEYEGKKIDIQGRMSEQGPTDFCISLSQFSFDKTQGHIMVEWLSKL